jgi:cytochrome c oxidase subunit II
VLRKRHLKLATVLAAASTLLLTGCTQQELHGYLPGSGETTNHTSSIVGLWVTSWIVLLSVGVISWGLMVWAIIAYRRRKGETGLPVQLRYNMPIETLFTVVPFIITVGFFAFTAKTMTAIETPNHPQNVIQVIGKQWSWDFNYTKDNVFDSGVQYQDGPNAKTEASLPTLYLEKGVRTEIDLTSRDVIHSFWVIDFLYKKDMFPGRVNRIYFTPTELGTFKGKCAELCGEFHSAMLFNVKVVNHDDYAKHIADLAAAGNTGQVGYDLNRYQTLPGKNAINN